MSEEQIPQVIVFSRKSSEKVEQKDRAFVRPRQVRYQAALRPDMKTGLILKYFQLDFHCPPTIFDRDRAPTALILAFLSLNHDRAHSFHSRHAPSVSLGMIGRCERSSIRPVCIKVLVLADSKRVASTMAIMLQISSLHQRC